MALAGLDHPRRPLDQLLPPEGLGLEQDALAGQREALGQAEHLGEILLARHHELPPRVVLEEATDGGGVDAPALCALPTPPA